MPKYEVTLTHQSSDETKTLCVEASDRTSAAEIAIARISRATRNASADYRIKRVERGSPTLE